MPRLTQIDPSKVGEVVELIGKLMAAGEIGALPPSMAEMEETWSKDFLSDLLDEEADEQVKDLFKDMYIPHSGSG